MDILIEIQCKTIDDLLKHLKTLHNHVLKQARVNQQDSKIDDFAGGTQFVYDSLYGSHELNVIEVIGKNKQDE